MINSIEKFGVRQRCIEGNKSLMEWLIVSLNFERDANVYILDDNSFVGIINKSVLYHSNISAEESETIKLKDICVNNTPEVVRWTEGEDLVNMIGNAFKNPIDEVVIVERGTNHMIGIINRNDFFRRYFLFSLTTTKK